MRSGFAGRSRRKLARTSGHNPRRPPEASVLRPFLVGCTAVGLLLGAFALAGDRLGLWQPMQVPRAPAPAGGRGVGLRPTGLAESTGRELPAYRDQAAPRPPRPPLSARTAFLLATLAAAIALLGSVATKLARAVSDARWARSARVRPARPPPSRADGARSLRFRPLIWDHARSKRLVSALAVLPRTLSQTPRRVAIAVAAGTRARLSFRWPRDVVAFHFAVSRYGRAEVAVYVLAIALGAAVGWLVALGAS
jgi:hypothetical protein